MMRRKMRRWFRKARFRASGGTRFETRVYNSVLVEALAGRPVHSDISDHLSTIFFFALDARPALIVELGTRGGESTRALLAAAEVCNATMLSIDIDDVAAIDVPFRDRWKFIRADDVEFGRSSFHGWCAANGFAPQADLLFIDTSHLYEHTKEEIAVWAPLLAPAGTMLFHDTNMGSGLFARLDGSIGRGWNNQRGVIRAIEEFLGRQYDESTFFDDLAGGYLIKHFPNCSGLTVLKRFTPRAS